jgi:hypothetical protein
LLRLRVHNLSAPSTTARTTKKPHEKNGASQPRPFSRRALAKSAGAHFLTLGLSGAAQIRFARASETQALLVPNETGRSFPARLAQFARCQPVDDSHPQRRPITVAGPWPICTAFRSPGQLKFSNAVYAPSHAVSNVGLGFTTHPMWVLVFAPVVEVAHSRRGSKPKPMRTPGA